MSGLSISRNVQSSAHPDFQPVSSRQVSLRDMVLTPARVPPFIIPPLCAVRSSGPRGVGGGSRRYTLPASAPSPRANRAHSRCCCPLSTLSLTDMQSTCAVSDPTTRAAMSLPHLVKITTPYGFVTLGESPCVPRRESLFFQDHQPQSQPSQEQQQCMKPRRESSSQSCDPAAHRCTPPQTKKHLNTSSDCAEELKCTHISSSLPRKKRLKYFLKKRFSA